MFSHYGFLLITEDVALDGDRDKSARSLLTLPHNTYNRYIRRPGRSVRVGRRDAFDEVR